MNKIINWDFDWTDFGIMIRVYKTTKICEYKYNLDLQVMWFALWIRFGKRKLKIKL